MISFVHVLLPPFGWKKKVGLKYKLSRDSVPKKGGEYCGVCYRPGLAGGSKNCTLFFLFCRAPFFCSNLFLPHSVNIMVYQSHGGERERGRGKGNE